MKTCKVEGCNGKQSSKGYCTKHYQQWKKHGKILDKTRYDKNEIITYDDYAEIILYDKYGNEKCRALIDVEDIDRVKDIRWHFDGRYVRNSNNEKLHRFIMNCPKDMVVDHINHNQLDNRKFNLRICTQQQNMMNRTRPSNNKSGCIGVSFNKSKNKWVSSITIDDKCISLGNYINKEDAIEARKQAEIKYFGEYRNINLD